MSNVIEVDFKGEKNCYFTEDNKLAGVVNEATELRMIEVDADHFEIFSEFPAILSRKNMAEFLWMAAYMLDSEQKWCKDEYVGLNYKDGE